NQLLSSGSIERGWLGVGIEERDNIVVIATVDRSGPAARSGLRPGDAVVAVNGERVESSRNLIRAVAAIAPGRDLRLTVRRQGREMDVPVTVGRRPLDSSG